MTNKNLFKILTQHDKDSLINILKIFDIVMNNLNIKYFLYYGTLLGAIRHKCIIPWDDDLDIVVSKYVFDNYSYLENELNKYNLKIIKQNDRIIKIFFEDGHKINNYKWRWPFIDLLKYEIINDKVFISKEYYDYNDIFPLKYTSFCNTIVTLVPSNYNKVLNNLFGLNWKTECKSSDFNHKKESFILLRSSMNCNKLKLITMNIFNNVWIINLERRKDRLVRTINILNKINIYPRIWKAYDSKSKDIIKKYNKLKSKKISIDEFACYLSHISLWKYILHYDIENVIIFEDDIIFNSLTKELILDEINKCIGFKFIFLGYCTFNPYKLLNKTTKIDQAQCCHAYVININFIKNILQHIDFKTAIDVLIEKVCKKEKDCYIVKNYNKKSNYYGNGMIFQDNNISSDIKKKIVF